MVKVGNKTLILHIKLKRFIFVKQKINFKTCILMKRGSIKSCILSSNLVFDHPNISLNQNPKKKTHIVEPTITKQIRFLSLVGRSVSAY